jgi:hypothetical protein
MRGIRVMLWQLLKYCLLILFISTTPLRAETIISGTIGSDQIWTNEDSPYIIAGNVTIAGNASLTIEDGCRVLFNYNTSIVVNGNILAIGEEGKEIVFSSNNDEKHGVFWKYIDFRKSLRGENSFFEFCKFEFGGNGGFGPLKVDGTSELVLENCLINYCFYNGISLELDDVESQLTLAENEHAYIINESQKIAADQSLSIEKGTVIKLEKNVDFEVIGQLLAGGELGREIVFTSIRDDEYGGDSDGEANTSGNSGDWGGMKFSRLSKGKGSVLRGVMLRYGGGSSLNNYSMLYIERSDPKIEYSTFESSAYHGITLFSKAEPDLGGGKQNSEGMNSFIGFGKGKFALRNTSSNDISAKNNCWGSDEIDDVIYDGNDNDNYGLVEYLPFREDCSPAAPEIPELLEPQNKERENEEKVIFKWKESNGAIIYKLKAFQDDKTFLEEETKDTAISIKLPLSSEFQWEIIAFNFTGDSSVSERWSFRTKDTAKPDRVLIEQPANGEMVDCSFEVILDEDQLADEYQIQLAKDEWFLDMIKDEKIKQIIVQIDLINNYDELYLRARGRNSNGYGEWSEVVRLIGADGFIIENLYETKEEIINIYPGNFDADTDFEYVLLTSDGENDNLYVLNRNSEWQSTKIYSAKEISSVSTGFFDVFIGLDLLVCSDSKLNIIKNNSGIFTKKVLEIVDFEVKTAEWIDIDNDLDLDIVVSGYRDSSPMTLLFELKNGEFIENEILTNLIASEFKIIDFDHNGFQDIALIGEDFSGLQHFELFTNDKGKFSKSPKRFEGYDDFLIDNYLLLWKNDGLGTTLELHEKTENDYEFYTEQAFDFEIESIKINVLLDGNSYVVATKDSKTIFIELDGKELKIDQDNSNLIEGRIADFGINKNEEIILISSLKDAAKLNFYSNQNCRESYTPGVPINLGFSYSDELIVLSWDGIDNKKIQYDVRIRDKATGVNIYSGNTGSIYQIERISRPNAGKNQFKLVNNLNSGYYEFSVRAINEKFNKSEFSEWKEFYTGDIRKLPPDSWKYQMRTGNNTTVLVRTDAEYGDNLDSIKVGDAVGAFYQSGEEIRCAGYSFWEEDQTMAITVWGDNYQTPDEKDGYEHQEHFIFKLWRSKAEEEIPISVNIEEGLSYYQRDTVSVISMIKGLDEVDLKIVKNRWQLIGLSLTPYKSELKEMLGLVELCMIRDDKEIYYPRHGIIGFENWTSSKGYEIHSGRDTTINVKGIKIQAESSPINIPGQVMSIIPYYLDQEICPEFVLNSIYENIVYLKDDESNYLIPEININEIESLLPGRAYKIVTSKSVSLIYNEDSTGECEMNEISPGLYYNKFDENTGSDMLLIFEGDILNENDEIAVKDTRGNICGSGKFRAGQAVVVVKGDNFITQAVEAARENETLSIKHWQSMKMRESNLFPAELVNLADGEEYKPELRYQKDGIYRVKVSKNPVISVNEDNRKTKMVGNIMEIIFENPFPQKLEIFDLLGRKVHEEYLDYLQSEATLNLSQLSKGAYVIAIEYAQSRDIIKILKD